MRTSHRPRPALDRQPKAKNAAEVEFLALGDGARLWLTEAAAAGSTKLRVKMAAAVTLAKLGNPVAVDWALGHAAVHGAASPRPTSPRSWPITPAPRPAPSARPVRTATSPKAPAAVREAGCGFSMGFSVDGPVQEAVLALAEASWTAAHDVDGSDRDGAWVSEITDRLNLSAWPSGARVMVRRERPHPGAQMRFTDSDGHRFTAFITDTGQLAELEVEHRSQARVEDRIRCGKDTGLRNMPCKSDATTRSGSN